MLISALWTFPSIILSAFVIGWGAEAAEVFISQGLALAILALLQTAPEFAVEAAIAWRQDVHLMLANLTGSLRLLVGLGWPMIYFTRAAFGKKGGRWSAIRLDDEHCVEIVGLGAALLYFLTITVRGSLHFWDGVVLLLIYIGYLWLLQQIPSKDVEEIEDMAAVPRWIVGRPRRQSILWIIAIFVGGGLTLYYVVDPFLESMLHMALFFGISNFVFVQWVAPFLSEFPEKVTAFNWARRQGKSGMALMNMVSSNVNQWTLLVFMMMAVFSFSRGRLDGITFDAHQQTELWLTWIQSLLALLILADMRLRWLEAVILFVLWLAQFLIPDLREEIIWVYVGIIALWFILLLARRRELRFLGALRPLLARPKRR